MRPQPGSAGRGELAEGEQQVCGRERASFLLLFPSALLGAAGRADHTAVSKCREAVVPPERAQHFPPERQLSPHLPPSERGRRTSAPPRLRAAPGEAGLRRAEVSLRVCIFLFLFFFSLIIHFLNVTGLVQKPPGKVEEAKEIVFGGVRKRTKME